MTFNVKSKFALEVSQSVLAKPMGTRHGITGFWRASLSRVKDERLIRVAYMPEHRFVFEAEIDAESTHTMTLARINEYIEHELLKRSKTKGVLSVSAIRNDMKQLIEQGRVVVAFRNARVIDGDTEHTGQNPIWYTMEN